MFASLALEHLLCVDSQVCRLSQECSIEVLSQAVSMWLSMQELQIWGEVEVWGASLRSSPLLTTQRKSQSKALFSLQEIQYLCVEAPHITGALGAYSDSLLVAVLLLLCLLLLPPLLSLLPIVSSSTMYLIAIPTPNFYLFIPSKEFYSTPRK